MRAAMCGRRTITGALMGMVLCLSAAAYLWAHCDTMDGPVVVAGRAALQDGDLTPVLKWVRPEHEEELRAAFQRARAVRGLDATARELADAYFLETLVRLHRAGEGEPYTGLKPAGYGLTPALAAADRALETGDAEAVIKLLSEQIRAGVQQRHHRVREAAQRMNQSVEAGRAYVAAYVDYIHYIEQIERLASARGQEPAAPQTGTAHHH
ncbi:DUF6448 family protein [Fontivita pretiosa]|uniref:DUF6448 family protein n=1 Tax=Fontivita pretiosa TaxID=2989684 RepID=UPI003D17C0BC